jgi:hypothetical protein
VASDGRIGILSSLEYRLRWYRDGALVETGPPIPWTSTRVTGADREAFRKKKELEPMGGATTMQGTGPARNAASRERVRAAWPDSIFPEVMPPFEVQGALLAPTGDIWVRRMGPATAPAETVDILDAHGKLRATLRLPPRTRLFALGARQVYLLRVDGDGFQTLEQYAYPVLRAG